MFCSLPFKDFDRARKEPALAYRPIGQHGISDLEEH
jgi:hypothetical protein